MGPVLAKLFKKKYKVAIAGRDPSSSAKAARLLGVQVAGLKDVGKADIVIASVPIDKTIEVCREVSSLLKPQSLFVDVASVKTGITKEISSILAPSIEYLSLHPLFGPGVNRFEEENILAVPVRPGQKTLEVLQMLERGGMRVSRVSEREHDAITATTQVLHHFAYLCLAVALDEVREDMSKYATRSLRSTLRLLKRFGLNLDPILTIQRYNPKGPEARAKFLEAVSQLSKMDEESVERIRRAMKRLNSKFP